MLVLPSLFKNLVSSLTPERDLEWLGKGERVENVR